MQGSLTQIQLPEILQFLSMGKGSGLLTLSRGGHEIVLHVRAGRIVNSSSIERQRRLGELLVQRGILRRSTLTEVLNLQRTIESDKRLGQILTERDIVKEQTIREVLRLQIEEEIWNLFSWEEGEFRFEHVESSKIGEAIVEIDIEPLILEGTRRQDEWKKIVKVFPSDNVILTVKRLEDDFRRDVKLTPTEWRVLSQVNGRFTIRAIINRSAMGRFETYSILYGFLKKGLVLIKAAPVPAAGDPSAANGVASAGTSGPGDESGGRRGGLLSFITSVAGKKTGATGDAVEYPTPVTALAAFINQAVEQFVATKDAKLTPADGTAIDTIFRDVVMHYTRADLIQVENNRISTDRMESYFQAFEYSPAIQDSFEDTMEALNAVLDAGYRHFALRIGDKAATKIVRDLLSSQAGRVHVRWGGPFSLEQRVQAILKLAA